MFFGSLLGSNSHLENTIMVCTGFVLLALADIISKLEV